MTEFEYKGLAIISENRRGRLVGSAANGIGPIAALLNVYTKFILREFGRERAFFRGLWCRNCEEATHVRDLGWTTMQIGSGPRWCICWRRHHLAEQLSVCSMQANSGGRGASIGFGVVRWSMKRVLTR